MLEQGYTHIYTGNGKGKTTAAFGLALRAYGAGLKTKIIQFMKGHVYSEHAALAVLSDLIDYESYGSKKFCRVDDESFTEHLEEARRGYDRASEVLMGDEYSVIILDEIITSLLFKLVTIDEIITLIDKKPQNKELILTGRGAPPELIERADLVTEMKEIKHYYKEGVMARKGIED